MRAALLLPVQLGHDRLGRRSLRQRVAVRTVRRRDHVALLERAADADGDRLLADRDVQEAGKIARAEQLLDLLLEAPDQEHLAVEVAQDLLRQGVSLLHFRHRAECTLRPVALVEKWWEIEHSLPPGWKEARLSLRMHGENYARRAAALLGPANPVRSGLRVTLYAAQHGAATAPKAVARLLTRLDEEGLSGELELVSVVEADAADAAGEGWLADAWDDSVAGLPEDWSDLYVELTLDSSDYLEPAALATAPLNPARWGDSAFASAARAGSATAPPRRWCGAAWSASTNVASPARCEILRALSDTKPVGTQGPVWYVGGSRV